MVWQEDHRVDDRLHDIPRVILWPDPTPLEPQPNLAAAAGASSIVIKRDDANGLAFGGNKVRQLEFYIGAALEQGADTVLVTGAVQSNFVRTTAAAARKVGMDVHIQLESRVAKQDPDYLQSGNVLLDTVLGATLHTYPEGEDEAGADRQLQEIADGLSRDGRSPYVIHMHPSHPPLGALGYVVAAEELAAQLDDLETGPDEIFVASGSGNTHAGLLYGLRRVGCDLSVTGICVRRDAAQQASRIHGHLSRIAEMLGVASPVPPDHVQVTDAFLAPGYGRASDETMAAIKLAAESEALICDPVYTGKVMAGMLASARREPGRPLAMIHTGGGPAIFGYAADMRAGLGHAG